ncbi:hypothetical protein [Thaumasiovibrio subtropicus]|uniref:hypothetical protein n=1 Tax=Thaumasiovibrio subtropicus TaxID=1891207 RepID=UPI00131DCF1E|nr:hypothetical protein [Thaumasiovibrio subtropicus]
MKTSKLLSIVLSSQIFFVVSCTCSAVPISKLLSHLNTPKYNYALVQDGDEVIFLDNQSTIEKYRSKQDINLPVSFLINQAHGQMPIDTATSLHYQVEQLNEKQRISIKIINDDWQTTFEYDATHSQISNINSHHWAVGHLFGAFPYAFLLALCLYLIGKRLRAQLSHV